MHLFNLLLIGFLVFSLNVLVMIKQFKNKKYKQSVLSASCAGFIIGVLYIIVLNNYLF